ncbi:MAG: type II toxin-antitoxin system RelE/ParE family toxin [Gammaproteobacteria bacterium]
MKIVFYGEKRKPVLDFIEKLPIEEQARILGCLKNIEELGFDCPRVMFRQIKGKLWEIKIQTVNSGYRIFYVTIMKNIMVLLHSYKKQSQKAPLKEINVSEKRMIEVLNNESFYIR